MRLWFGNKGLGPNSWGPIRYLFPCNRLFHKSAVQHDILYGIHGDKQKADKMFLRMMLAVSKTYDEIDYAWRYHNLVDQFGYLFYK